MCGSLLDCASDKPTIADLYPMMFHNRETDYLWVCAAISSMNGHFVCTFFHWEEKKILEDLFHTFWSASLLPFPRIQGMLEVWS